jgi:hypothetical protein
MGHQLETALHVTVQWKSCSLLSAKMAEIAVEQRKAWGDYCNENNGEEHVTYSMMLSEIESTLNL